MVSGFEVRHKTARRISVKPRVAAVFCRMKTVGALNLKVPWSPRGSGDQGPTGAEPVQHQLHRFRGADQ